MADLIDRQAVWKVACKGCTMHGNNIGECYESEPCGNLNAAFVTAPAVEAEPVKHGRWEGTADGYADGELVYDMWECSECGYDADGADEKPEWRYCPNCGAKMYLEG